MPFDPNQRGPEYIRKLHQLQRKVEMSKTDLEWTSHAARTESAKKIKAIALEVIAEVAPMGRMMTPAETRVYEAAEKAVDFTTAIADLSQKMYDKKVLLDSVLTVLPSRIQHLSTAANAVKGPEFQGGH